MTSFTLTEEQEHRLADLAIIYQQSPEELLEDFFEQYLRDKAETRTDTLHAFAADLITESAFRPFLIRLFTRLMGNWQPLHILCADLPTFEERIERDAIPQTIVEDITVLWLPNSWAASDLAVVLFFCNNPFWYTVALVNLEYVLGLSPSVG